MVTKQTKLLHAFCVGAFRVSANTEAKPSNGEATKHRFRIYDLGVDPPANSARLMRRRVVESKKVMTGRNSKAGRIFA